MQFADEGLRIALVNPADAEIVWEITRVAFAEQRGRVNPPSGALRETVEAVRADLMAGEGAVAWLGQEAVGAIRAHPRADHLYVGRLAVHPEARRRGIGRALMAWAEERARQLGLPAIQLGVRVSLREVLDFYQRLGYEVVGEGHHPGFDRPTFYWLRKRVAGPEASGAAPD